MSKIIRTVRLGGEVITLGAAERDLHEEAEEQSLDSIGLAQIIDEQVTGVRKQLDTEWEAKLRQEMEYLQAEADKRLQASEAQGEEQRGEVHQQRYEEGYQVGLDEREAESVEAVARIGVLHESMIAERAQVLKEAEETVVNLAAALAKRIVGFQVEASPKVLVQVVRSALRHLSDSSNLEIKVHPDDLQMARRFAAHWVEKVDEDAVLKVRASDHVGRGGCMIEGREENVDARLEEQAQVLHDGLRAAFFAVHAEDAPEENAISVGVTADDELATDATDEMLAVDTVTETAEEDLTAEATDEDATADAADETKNE